MPNSVQPPVARLVGKRTPRLDAEGVRENIIHARIVHDPSVASIGHDLQRRPWPDRLVVECADGGDRAVPELSQVHRISIRDGLAEIHGGPTAGDVVHPVGWVRNRGAETGPQVVDAIAERDEAGEVPCEHGYRDRGQNDLYSEFTASAGQSPH